MITEASRLNQFAAAARETGVCALDTEFVWERTYYPCLGLVQMSAGVAEPALLDPMTPMATDALSTLLAADDTVKILHDARQDLWILKRYCGGLPRNVFDTRTAAGFAGMAGTLSLAALHEQILGITLAKTETRTDWCRRPLSPQQLEYAKDDVRHLSVLRDRLLAEVERRNRVAWLTEEMAILESEELYAEPSLRVAFQRVKGAGRLDRPQLSVLRELTEWRDGLARRLDRPRGFILPDADLLAIADRAPANASELARTAIPHRILERNGTAILAAVAKGLAVPPAEQPPIMRGQRPDERMKAAIEAAMTALRIRAETLEMDPTFIAPRAEVTALATADAPADERCRLLSGWRAETVGEAILAAIRTAR